jgi:fatty acid desaturase
MPNQDYSPFRTTLLTREQLRSLSELRPSVAIRDTLFHWTMILGAWTVVALWLNVYTVVGCFLVVGTNFYALYVILHDGMHRRLFTSVRRNDFWTDVLIMGSIGGITRLNRHNHMKHHHVTCFPDDPDRFKYVHDGKEPFFHFTVFLSGLASMLPAARNVFLGLTQSERAGPRYAARDLTIILIWQSALIGGLSYFIAWWAYPVLWLAPAYVLGFRADMVRVFCEHSMMTSDASADESMRLITYDSFWLEKLFFAPRNMNYHMVHHLWTSIPYYNLPKADGIIRQSAAVRSGDKRLIWRPSYVGYLISYLRWRLHEGRAVFATN